MPDYGSNRKTTGGAKIKDGTDGNYDQGKLGGFRTKGGAAKAGPGLANDAGGGNSQFKDTYNDASGAGHGGGYKKPRAGDA